MIQVIGYAEVNGAKTFSDGTLYAIYEQFAKDGTIKIIFSDGSISNSGQFVAFFKDPQNIICLPLVDGEIMGMAWLNGAYRNHAFVHYGLFKKAWGVHTIDIAHAIIDYWFSFNNHLGEPMLEVLLGQTPEWNRKAVSFLKRLGWTPIGTIPKIANGAGAVISYLTREDYGKNKQSSPGHAND